MKIGVSILNSKDLKRDLELLNNTNCDYFHIDVMDNKFVTNKNDPYDILKYYENLYNKRLDVHLMCEKPLSYIDKYINLNTEFITFHVEIKEDIEKIIKHIKEYGIICATGLLGGKWYLEDFDPTRDIKNNAYLTTFYSGNVNGERINSMLDYIEKYKIDIKAEKIFSLDEIAEAHKYLDSSLAFGKVIVINK